MSPCEIMSSHLCSIILYSIIFSSLRFRIYTQFTAELLDFVYTQPCFRKRIPHYFLNCYANFTYCICSPSLYAFSPMALSGTITCLPIDLPHAFVTYSLVLHLCKLYKGIRFCILVQFYDLFICCTMSISPVGDGLWMFCVF